MLKKTANLTQGYSDEQAGQIDRTHPGMAHFASTGPFGATCKECAHFGYQRIVRNAAGDAVRTLHHRGCRKFLHFTGRHGPTFPSEAAARRHFERISS